MNVAVGEQVDVELHHARGGSRHKPSLPNFELLLGREAWSRLPDAVRARFSVDAHSATAVVYEGRASVRATLTGRLFAHLCRCVGTPVAPYIGEDVRMLVRVHANDTGVVWERHYDFGTRTCVVRSTKEVDGAGLIENLGFGLNMSLDVYEADGELHFASTGYFFRVGRLRLPLPDWFLPGGTHVTHADLGDGRFRFTLQTHHRWFGCVFHQDGIFHSR